MDDCLPKPKHLTVVSELPTKETNTMDILGYWDSCMTTQDLGSRTIKERIQFIEQLQREAGELITITRQDLIVWAARKKWSNKTRLNYRSRMITFFTWLQDEGYRLDNPAYRLPKVKDRKGEPNPFTVDEIEVLLNSGIYKATRVMVAIHYYLGLRVSEIAGINGGNDVNWAKQTITVTGKGRKRVIHPVPAALWPLMETMPRNGYWFPNHKPNRLYGAREGHILGNSVSTILCTAIRRAGLDHRAHDLRASTATEMNGAGVSSFVVQKAMRHANMSTTTIYMGLTVEQVRDGLNRLPVVAMPKRSGRGRAA